MSETGPQAPIPGTPVTPLATVWNSIQNAVGFLSGYPRNSAPPFPSQPERPRDEDRQWLDIRRAEGRRKLENEISSYLAMAQRRRANALQELLVRIAREHGEDLEVTHRRFRLRYLSDAELVAVSSVLYMDTEELANRVTQMLVDELDLPGQRFGTAVRRWHDVVRQAHSAASQGSADEDSRSRRGDVQVDEQLERRVGRFLRDHGFRTLVQASELTSIDEGDTLFPDFLIGSLDADDHHGNRVGVWEPVERVEVVVFAIAAALQGIPSVTLTPSISLTPGSIPEWEEEADRSPEARECGDEQRRGVQKSLQVLRDMVAEPDVTWWQVFHLLQRHIDLYGLKDLVSDADSTLPRGLSERLATSSEDVAYDMGRLNHRFSFEDSVAAMLADATIARSRGTTASWPPSNGGRRTRRSPSDVEADEVGEDRDMPNDGDHVGPLYYDDDDGASPSPPIPARISDRDIRMAWFMRKVAGLWVEGEEKVRKRRRAGTRSRQQWLQMEIYMLDRELGRERGPRLTDYGLEARFPEVLARAVAKWWDDADERTRLAKLRGRFEEDVDGDGAGSIFLFLFVVFVQQLLVFLIILIILFIVLLVLSIFLLIILRRRRRPTTSLSAPKPKNRNRSRHPANNDTAGNLRTPGPAKPATRTTIPPGVAPLAQELRRSGRIAAIAARQQQDAPGDGAGGAVAAAPAGKRKRATTTAAKGKGGGNKRAKK
ncbi:hypothetical protein B0A55_05924 [Friedmanniomyces simplex]|uniref:Uncharacterized protein n=1 Tax=Friedmanniomyces simplex TaxID=329884 RepID=A0A4U0XFI9_9PEZI|nr:hypothetical protein B0A55_05924 [Friedmanniomyces simplex]